MSPQAWLPKQIWRVKRLVVKSTVIFIRVMV
nr:MAG TPA: hypothetical protein [Caudoviricetes sp.]